MTDLKNYSTDELKAEIERRENLPAMRPTTELEREAFDFLNMLRDTGVTNMFGARPYLMEEFGWDRDKQKLAGTLLTTWMKVFNSDGDYSEIPASIEPITD